MVTARVHKAKRTFYCLPADTLRCPRCTNEYAYEAYAKMERKAWAAEHTVDILVCPSCRWRFAPLPEAVNR